MKSTRFMQRVMRGAALSLSGLVVAVTGYLADIKDAEAVPAFARKYEMTCNVCHTRQPRLNTFGQRFLENGYQLPGTADGGIKQKHLFGGETNGATLDDVGNYLAVRLRADIQKANFEDNTEAMEELGVSDDVEVVFPRTVNIFFAGTATKNISFFFEAEYDTQDPAETALAFERSMLMFDNLLGPQVANVKIGVFDPSSFYSFPTHRQQLNPIKPVAESDEFPPPIGRIPLLPLAFASKMFGLTTGPSQAGDFVATLNPNMGMGPTGAVDTYGTKGNEGLSILPFEPYLYNAPFQKGVSVHGRPFGPNLLYQVGIAQNKTAEDVRRTRWDTYAMLRADVVKGDYSAFQVSAFYYNAPKAARAALAPPAATPFAGDMIFAEEATDWARYGIGARWQYKALDVYGTAIWDEIDKPVFGNAILDTSKWDAKALGVSVEADYLMNSKWMLGARYDYMDAGGLEELPTAVQGDDPKVNQQASFLGVIAKYYPTPNIGLYCRAHFNLEDAVNLPSALGGDVHPARNLTSLYAVGVDMAF